MKGKKGLWKRTDSRIRLFCRRLTERQRLCFLLALFLPFLIGCIHAIGTSLHRLGCGYKGSLEIEHVRSLELREENENEHSTQFYEDGHKENQDFVENTF